MKNLKIINQQQLKDWAKEIFKKNSFNMVDVSSKKETFRRALASGKIYVGKDVFDLIKNNKVDFRYIELMQTGDNLDYFNKYHISSKIFKEYLNKNNWIYQTLGKDAGPSLNYINPEFKGKFGIIAPYSKDFCRSCNRLRITSRGDLRLCLFGNTGISIRHLLQKDDQTEELQDLIVGQMKYKKESHYLELGETGLTKNLSTTGG